MKKILLLMVFIFYIAFISAVEIVPSSYTFDRSTDTGSYAYHDWGGRQLIDGAYGVAPWSANLGNGNAYEWVGWVRDSVINIDFTFNSTYYFDQINVGTVQDHPGDVVMPTVDIYSKASSGSAWSYVSTISVPESTANNNLYRTLQFTNLNINARYIRVVAKHSLDGPWTFLDEVDFYGQTAMPNLSTGDANFGNVRIGTSSNAAITVTNSGDSGSTLTGNIGHASGEFSPTSGAQSFSLVQNQTASRTFTYTPANQGTDSENVTVTTNEVGNTNVSLTGTGVSPEFNSSVAPDSTIDFGMIHLNRSVLDHPDIPPTKYHTITISNITTSLDLDNLTDLSILNAYITGDGTFDLIGFTPVILGKDDSLDLIIRFSTIMAHNDGVSPSKGLKNAILTLVTDQNAAFGEQGDIFTFNLTGQVVPEVSSLVILGLAIFFMSFTKRFLK